MERDPLLKLIQNTRQQINRYYRHVPVAVLESPDLSNGWSIKDLLTHIASWEVYVIQVLNGRESASITAAQVEAHNQATFNSRQDWTWSEVEADARQVFGELLFTLQTVSASLLNDPEIAAAIAASTYEHYTEHLSMLQEWSLRWRNSREE